MSARPNIRTKNDGTVVVDAVSLQDSQFFKAWSLIEANIGASLIVTFKNKLIISVINKGMYISDDGETFVPFLSTALQCWAYQVFGGSLYFAAQYDAGGGLTGTRVYRYDGIAAPSIVFDTTPGVGGGGGLIESLGIFNGAILFGRRDVGDTNNGGIWRSPTGTLGSWVRVYNTTFAKSIYGFVQVGANFYAVDGEPLGAPSHVFRSANGIAWVLDSTYANISGFRGHTESERAQLEVNAAGVPLYAYFGTFNGDVVSWDATTVERMFRLKYVANPAAGFGTGIRCRRIGNVMYIAYDYTMQGNRGDLVCWDGEKLNWLIKDFPYSIVDIELFQGYLWLACVTGVSIPGTWTVQPGVLEYVLFRMSLSEYSKQMKVPFMVPLWEADAVAAPGGATAPARIPGLGYRMKKFSILSTQAGEAYIQAKNPITLAWADITALGDFAVLANIIQAMKVTAGGHELTIRFVPSVNATVSSWVEVE